MSEKLSYSVSYVENFTFAEIESAIRPYECRSYFEILHLIYSLPFNYEGMIQTLKEIIKTAEYCDENEDINDDADCQVEDTIADIRKRIENVQKHSSAASGYTTHQLIAIDLLDAFLEAIDTFTILDCFAACAEDWIEECRKRMKEAHHG